MIVELWTVMFEPKTSPGLFHSSTCLAALQGLDKTWRTKWKEVQQDPVETVSAGQVDTSRVVGRKEVEFTRWTIESFVFQASPSLWGFTEDILTLTRGVQSSGEDDDIAAQQYMFNFSKRLTEDIARRTRDITKSKVSIKSLTKTPLRPAGRMLIT